MYAGNIQYYQLLNQAEEVVIETQESWVKQSYRNRCSIYSANGKLDLSIPVLNNKIKRETTAEKRISYIDDWQTIHWRSIKSAYSASPFFEYYEHDLLPFFTEETTSILAFNTQLQNKLLELLKIDVDIHYTTEYIPTSGKFTDYREAFNPKKPIPFTAPSYIQVFSDKHPFLPNLSIFDLLFCEGPNAVSFL